MTCWNSLATGKVLSRHFKIVALALVVVMLGAPVWAQPICHHNMASHSEASECTMTNMGPVPNVARPLMISCCYIQAAGPVSVVVIKTPMGSLGAIHSDHSCHNLSSAHSVSRSMPDERAQSSPIARQASLCIFLI